MYEITNSEFWSAERVYLISIDVNGTEATGLGYSKDEAYAQAVRDASDQGLI